VLLLKRQSLGYRLEEVRILPEGFRSPAYIVESRHFRKAHVFRSTNEWFLSRREDVALEVCRTTVAIYENIAFTEMGLAAAVEVFVGIAKLVEIGGGFGSLGIW
jgi:hypothetical protein